MSKNVKLTLIGISIIYILIGLALILWPSNSSLVICYILGAACLIYGVLSIVLAFKNRTGSGIPVGMIIGIALSLIGMVMLLRADVIVKIFGVIFGIAIIADSLLKLKIALDIKALGSSSWLAMVIASAIMIVLGVILVFNPFQAAVTACIISGIMLLLDGAINIWSIIAAAKFSKSETVVYTTRLK